MWGEVRQNKREPLFNWNTTNEEMYLSLKWLLFALQVLKACDLESMTCSRLTESSAPQKPTDSISCIEITQENIPDGNDKLQRDRFKNTQFNLQTSSFPG